jgi:glycosyltransferase involved in cell wall biosynthesis
MLTIEASSNAGDDQLEIVERLRRAREAFAEGDLTSAILPPEYSQQVLSASEITQTGKVLEIPRASIIVASYRAEPNLGPALREVARQAAEIGAEIILVNNGNPELAVTAALHFRSFSTITPPMQAGCSLARNLGALQARSEHLIFIDDDGVLAPRALRALLDALHTTNAIAVRGKVVPLTDPTLTASHYDLGDLPATSLITAEGISIWRRSLFLAAGGFDPLLAGHEGLALSWKLWRFHGPHSMRYEPRAVLLHDFAADKSRSEAKKEQHKRNQDYLAVHTPRAAKLHETRLKHDNYLRETILNTAVPSKPRGQSTPVSILTTVRNGLRWVQDYSQSWKSQTFSDFQLVVVDDGSLDGTSERLEELWADDSRLTLIHGPGAGRGAALNTAVQHARHDICLIADFDDISVPRRIEMTETWLADRPDCDWISFLAFTEDNHYRIGFPTSLSISDLRLRSLFGMPASFPTVAFRKSRFLLPFDIDLRAGVDCDWVRRNLLGNPEIKGELVHQPAVYYRIHDNQLSAIYGREQNNTRRELILQGFGWILGHVSATDEKWITVITGNQEVTVEEKREIARWMTRLLCVNQERVAFDQNGLSVIMQEAFLRLRLKQPPAPSITPKPVSLSKPPPKAQPEAAPEPARHSSTRGKGFLGLFGRE